MSNLPDSALVAESISDSFVQHYQQSPNGAATARSFPLYNDIVQHVMTFLTSSQLHTAIQLSTQWFLMLQSMKPLRIGAIVPTRKSDLAHIPFHSTIGRHIGHSDAITVLNSIADHELLLRLPAVFPNLKSLFVKFDEASESAPSPPSEYQCSFPPNLQSLTIHVDWTWASIAFPLIGSLSNLAELDLSLYNLSSSHESLSGIDFSPLKQLQNLDTMVLGFRYFGKEEQPHPSFIDFMRGQSRLTALTITADADDDPKTVDSWTSNLLRQISFAGPSCPLIQQAGPLRSINSAVRLDHDFLEALSGFPSLTELAYAFDIDDMALDKAQILLQRLPNIQYFEPIHASRFLPLRTTMSGIVVSCQNLPNLRELVLVNWLITESQFDQCLACLPKLTALHLSDCKGGTSLLPLSKYGIPQRLQSLLLSTLEISETDLINFVLPLLELRFLSFHAARGYIKLPEVQRLALREKLLALPNLHEDSCVYL